MAQPVNDELYLAAIARVCRGSNVIGVGFFVADGYLMTCAHVVSKALGHNRKSYQIPAADILGQEIDLEFRVANTEQPAKATVVYWRCPKHDPAADKDVAVLKLQGSIPAGAKILPLSIPSDYWEKEFRVLGFPAKLDPGGWATGTTMAPVYDLDGMVQMKDNQATGYAIEPGFSGAPVWSPSLGNAIIGIVVARDKEREEAKVGYMLPVSRLKRALEAVELESLLDILGPQAVVVSDAVAIAYRAAAGDRLSAFPLSSQADRALALRENLTQLLSIPSQRDSVPDMLTLVGAMLTLPELGLAAELRTALTHWLEHRGADLAALVAVAQQSLAPILAQRHQTTEAHLLLWVRTSPDYDSKARYLVSAVFIPDASVYDPVSGAGGITLTAVNRFRDSLQGDTVAKADLEKVLQACLQEISTSHGQALIEKELTLEMLLPIPLLDSEVDHWDEQAKQQLPPHLQALVDEESVAIFPIGFRYPVVLRIAERVEPYFSHLRSPWQNKWTSIKAAIASQQQAKKVLTSGHCHDFQTVFAKADCLGMHLVNTLPPKDRQQRLLALVMGAAPAALWLRKSPPKTQCKRFFNGLLEHPLGEIACKVREARKAAFEKRSDRHFGHHLALVWENPKLVPTETAAPTADYPLEMPH
ncbi:trypsin-like peptidase domain-containing protein [Nodosilinea sp. LEGE 07088]|uniref:VMAP-C domain-containing protein n=1 Tax=Nodosilinea sp. LEGE 07088 TaxID=2777968 RepID=UPI001880EFB2|nr:trypsin-like peptidase domain-containing protein [Nodosilinea sp. LEGE 07088]MBE9141259.1 trypsin-like peptidase domain-containing protein [Nodosilinea sp. LEGE 07088]